MERRMRTHDDDNTIKQPEIATEKKPMTEKKKQKRPDHEKEEDRISQLPDAMLHHIILLIPFKCAVRTSILSKRWKGLWAYTTTLDFGREFTTSVSLSVHLLACAIDRVLQQHRGKTIETFRLYFCPQEEFLPHIQRWILFAMKNRVRELDLDFTPYQTTRQDFALRLYELPPCLFVSCGSLTILKLSDCKFKLPSRFRGFRSLKTLHLTRVEITHYTLDGMLLKCPMLEDLALMVCCCSKPLELSATNLKIKSFALTGYISLVNVGSFSSKLAPHLQILTICHVKIEDSNVQGRENAPGNSPIAFPNLIELHLGVCNGSSLAAVYAFFKNWSFPCLEKLMLEWIPDNFRESDQMIQQTSFVFHHLKTIKIDRFFGTDKQMQMVKFLLEKAVALETMVFVIPTQDIKESPRNNYISQAKSKVAHLTLLHEQLLLMSKGSTNARFVLKSHTEDDDSVFATHYRYPRALLS